MIWESNQSRQFNTCKEGYCPIPETPWQTSINLTEYDKIRSQKNKIAVDIQTWEAIRKDFYIIGIPAYYTFYKYR